MHSFFLNEDSILKTDFKFTYCQSFQKIHGGNKFNRGIHLPKEKGLLSTFLTLL